MALNFIDDSGAIIYQPGSYAKFTVENTVSGLATSGVITLIGEADSGPSFSQETDITQNVFGPGQLDAVVAKYGSGNIVNAFSVLPAPSKDTDVQGAPSAIYIVKTNTGDAASKQLARPGLSNYRKMRDVSYGSNGNAIMESVTAVEEIAPTTGAIAFASHFYNTGTTDYIITYGARVNGGAAQTFTHTVQSVTTAGSASMAAATLLTPAQFAAGWNSLTGIMATGGVDRDVLNGISATSSLALTAVSSSTITITLSGAATSWATIPTAGDILVLPILGSFGTSASSILSSSGNNLGMFVVTSATATTISAKLLTHATSAGGTLTTVGATSISATPANDLKVFSPVVVQNMTGTDRGMLTGKVGTSVAVTFNVTTQVMTATISGAWNAIPAVGDIVHIPTGSAYAGGGSVNVGWYEVTSANSTTIVATRLSNSASLVNVTAAIGAVTDLSAMRPAIDGVGKNLSIFDGSGGTNISTELFSSDGSTVSWIETSSVESPLVSSQEQEDTINVSRSSTGQQEAWTCGGDVVLLVGYNGTTATITVGSNNTITTSVVGGSGSNLSISLANFLTLGDLAGFINSQTGYSCEVALPAFRGFPSWSLDQGTFTICSSFSGHTPGRIKKDAYDVQSQTDQSLLIRLVDSSTGSPVVMGGTLASPTVSTYVTTGSGLPEVESASFLSGGTKGGTSDSDVGDALSACQKLRTNFVVPLFSRDASLDILEGLTDASSDYTIDSINAATSTHVLVMSQLKKRRNRQAFLSIKDTFANAKVAAQTVANARCSMSFMDVKIVNAQSKIQQFQPWMGACVASAMQAAGFYKPIFNKLLNINGALQAAGDFSPNDTDQVDAALQAGLLIIGPDDTNVSFKFVSDNTTYSVPDNNFVYNSIQAIYVADIIALSTARELERQFVGKSLADVSAAIIKSVLAGIMKNFMRLKLITSSDGAPAGYKDDKVVISGPVAKVSFVVFEATGLYFIPVSFVISPVQQSA